MGGGGGYAQVSAEGEGGVVEATGGEGAWGAPSMCVYVTGGGVGGGSTEGDGGGKRCVGLSPCLFCFSSIIKLRGHVYRLLISIRFDNTELVIRTVTTNNTGSVLLWAAVPHQSFIRRFPRSVVNCLSQRPVSQP